MPASGGRTTPRRPDGSCPPNSSPSANDERRACAASTPHPPTGGLRNETTGKCPLKERSAEKYPTPVLACRLRESDPCRSDGSKRILPLRDDGWSQATRAADQTNYTNECAARARREVRPCVRGRRPALPPRQTWTLPPRKPKSAGP